MPLNDVVRLTFKQVIHLMISVVMVATGKAIGIALAFLCDVQSLLGQKLTPLMEILSTRFICFGDIL